MQFTKHALRFQRIETATRRSGGAITLSVFQPASYVMDVVTATIIATRQDAVSSVYQKPHVQCVLPIHVCEPMRLYRFIIFKKIPNISMVVSNVCQFATHHHQYESDHEGTIVTSCAILVQTFCPMLFHLVLYRFFLFGL